MKKNPFSWAVLLVFLLESAITAMEIAAARYAMAVVFSIFTLIAGLCFATFFLPDGRTLYGICVRLLFCRRHGCGHKGWILLRKEEIERREGIFFFQPSVFVTNDARVRCRRCGMVHRRTGTIVYPVTSDQ